MLTIYLSRYLSVYYILSTMHLTLASARDILTEKISATNVLGAVALTK